MDWKQEVLSRLDAVAAKLGTTTTYLWQVLVKQAVVQGGISLADALGLGILFYITYRVGKYTVKLAIGNPEGRYHDESGYWYIATGVCAIAAIIFVMQGIDAGTDAMAHFINPQYYALHEVLQALGK